MTLPMNLQVGRVTPCAPQDRACHPDGAHGVTRPTALYGFRSPRREDLPRGIFSCLKEMWSDDIDNSNVPNMIALP